MRIFGKKKIEFVSAICPECKGNLELDAKLERAFCQYCGAQCIVENAPKRKPQQNDLERVLDFVERQQALRRQDKQEKRRRKEEAEAKQKEELKKTWWIYLAIVAGLMVFAVILSILENYGIV